jgi:hypothetical protein
MEAVVTSEFSCGRWRPAVGQWVIPLLFAMNLLLVPHAQAQDTLYQSTISSQMTTA